MRVLSRAASVGLTRYLRGFLCAWRETQPWRWIAALSAVRLRLPATSRFGICACSFQCYSLAPPPSGWSWLACMKITKPQYRAATVVAEIGGSVSSITMSRRVTCLTRGARLSPSLAIVTCEPAGRIAGSLTTGPRPILYFASLGGFAEPAGRLDFPRVVLRARAEPKAMSRLARLAASLRAAFCQPNLSPTLSYSASIGVSSAQRRTMTMQSGCGHA